MTEPTQAIVAELREGGIDLPPETEAAIEEAKRSGHAEARR